MEIKIVRHVIVSAVFLIWAVPCFATKHFFWQVSSPVTTVYLLGSIHMAKPEFYPLDPVIEKSFADADYLVLEVRMDPMSMYTMGKGIRDQGMYSGSQTVFDHIDKQTADMFRNYLKHKNLPLSLFSKYKPGMIMMQLAALEIQKMGFSPQHGIDMYFMRKANGMKRPVLGLETAQQQIAFLAELPGDSALLRYSILSLKDLPQKMGEIVQAWKTGDTKAMHALFTDTVAEYKKLKPVMKILIDDRNVKMAEKIGAYLKSDKVYFIVVGAGHLTGPLGLPSLLKKAGFTVLQK